MNPNCNQVLKEEKEGICDNKPVIKNTLENPSQNLEYKLKISYIINEPTAPLKALTILRRTENKKFGFGLLFKKIWHFYKACHGQRLFSIKTYQGLFSIKNIKHYVSLNISRI
ncbi:hypothetical protein DICPUDRAFT_83122 [Dictyostelium purpureum]|uniref:Uncharacterized protein n=1 Tax=Dictyostelium purpureum TaxID=5786 RepID=F0ZYL3_DICPU|nr:uncharacterized protein DICPUDRAFT_83122 [Dictyostelium purpureum]EGC30961.1 hypothetical protein DICPUDRAFT_83122 [Dictyostelium purpureum]|eukprot:XP_003292512.1 hypothetical protein DICPUDRAFT_83122 [Dictyostelium purpureum]